MVLIITVGICVRSRSPRTDVLGNSQSSLRDWSCWERIPRTAPDFLYAALDMSAYAAFFTESRMRLIDSTKPNRKSGFVLGYFQPSLRDWYRHNPDGWLVFGECCPNEPLEKPNLDKSYSQASLRDLLRPIRRVPVPGPSLAFSARFAEQVRSPAVD